MKRVSGASARSRFIVTATSLAQRTLQRETETWERENAARSQLPDEYDAALEALAVQPFIGVRLRSRRKHVRKLLLRRTGFFVVYEVKPRSRVVTIVSVRPKRSLSQRR